MYNTAKLHDMILCEQMSMTLELYREHAGWCSGDEVKKKKTGMWKILGTYEYTDMTFIGLGDQF